MLKKFFHFRLIRSVYSTFLFCAPATFGRFFKMINYILSGTFPVMIWRIFGLVNPDFGYNLLRDRSNLLREIATANFCLLWVANWIYFEFLNCIKKQIGLFMNSSYFSNRLSSTSGHSRSHLFQALFRSHLFQALFRIW